MRGPSSLALQDEHVAAIGLREQSLVEHYVGRPRGDDPTVDECGLMESLGGTQQVVGGGDHGPAEPRLRLEHVHQVFLGRRVHAGDGLVQQEHDLVPLRAPAPGTRVDVGHRTRRRSDGRAGRPCARSRSAAADLVAVDARWSTADADEWISTHHHDVRRRPPGIASRPPPPGADTRPGVAARPTGCAEHLTAPRHGTQQPGHDLEQGALARSVGSDHGQQRTRRPPPGGHRRGPDGRHSRRRHRRARWPRA